MSCLTSVMFSGQQAYDGSAFAAYEDVIVVTTNYRTNGTLCNVISQNTSNSPQYLDFLALQN